MLMIAVIPTPDNTTGTIEQNPAAAMRTIIWVGTLVVAIFATLVVYLPSMHGEMLWDDNAHVTRTELQSLDGLRRIWFELGATQQYYPLLHTAFWSEPPPFRHIHDIIDNGSIRVLSGALVNDDEDVTRDMAPAARDLDCATWHPWL